MKNSLRISADPSRPGATTFTMQALTPELRQRIRDIVGKPLVHVQPIQRGYTSALRLVAFLADGSSVFVKIGTTDQTSEWLRRERHIYESLSTPFLARFLGWDDDTQHPLLVLEDLSEGFWPPLWTTERIRRVIGTLEKVCGPTVNGLPVLKEDTELAEGWTRVAKDPEPFLSLGMATEQWFNDALPTLLAVEGEKVLSGQSLLHRDVRSGNICFVGDRTILVDWNWAGIGNPQVDIGGWLPSLEVEGGPSPEAILPDAGEIAAIVSGYFASKAGLPPIADAQHVRRLQLAQLKSALPWAVRALELPPLDA